MNAYGFIKKCFLTDWNEPVKHKNVYVRMGPFVDGQYYLFSVSIIRPNFLEIIDHQGSSRTIGKDSALVVKELGFERRVAGCKTILTLGVPA